jgi:heme exporter protein A
VQIRVTFEVKNLSCRRSGREVFSGLDFTLIPSELLTVTGVNGSGKSSLLRLLAGFLRPSSGAMLWDGAPIAEDREAFGARTAYVGHLDAVKSALTVEENLAFWAHFDGSAVGDTRVQLALQRVDLVAQANLPAGFLSAGQKRRLNLARLVAKPASLWLLDEPTAALDDKSSGTVADIIQEHCAQGGMAVVTTHQDLGIEAAQSLDMNDYRPEFALGPNLELVS